MAQDQEMQKKAMEFRMLQERGAAMQGQLTALKNLIEEAESTSKSLEALCATGQESVLFPLGAGVIVKAKPLSPGRVLVEEGAGVVLEKDAKDAMRQLEQRRAKLIQAFDSFNSQLSKLSERLDVLRADLMQYR